MFFSVGGCTHVVNKWHIGLSGVDSGGEISVFNPLLIMVVVL